MNYIQTDSNGDKFVKMERVYDIKQDLADEPYFITNIKRFISGSVIVKAKIEGNYKLILRSFGSAPYVKNSATADEIGHDHYIDGHGFDCWVLSSVQNSKVFLPGQGFVLFVIPQGCSTLESLVGKQPVEVNGIVVEAEADIGDAAEAQQIEGEATQQGEETRVATDAAGMALKSNT